MKLIRYRYQSDRTLGKLVYSGYTFETMEREGPDSKEKNARRICAGIYPITSLYRGDYRIDVGNVPGRTGIQLHTGSKPVHSTGCILVLGSKQLGLTSKASIKLLQNLRPLRIEIINS